LSSRDDPQGPAPTAPATAPSAAAEALEFPCPNCGAETTWDPDVDALACAYCGTTTPVPRAAGAIEEHALEAVGEAARGLGLETRTADCRNCGARVAFGDVDTAATCVFCGSANVLAHESNRNTLRPESLIPLDVGRATVEENFRRWVRGLWFRPDALRRLASFDAVGVYVPYWTFDARVRSRWSADSGTYYWTTQVVPVVVNGRVRMRTRRVRRVRWRPASGVREDRYDDHLVNASGGIPDDLARRLGGFDTSKLVPYRPEYLAGWRAEEYRVDLQQAWELGRQAIEERQRLRCAADVPGETHRDLRVHNVVSDVRWKHVLLPIWSLQYRFRGEVRTVMVNGQTGVISGRVPYSPVKLALVFLAVALLVVLLGVASGNL